MWQTISQWLQELNANRLMTIERKSFLKGTWDQSLACCGGVRAWSKEVGLGDLCQAMESAGNRKSGQSSMKPIGVGLRGFEAHPPHFRTTTGQICPLSVGKQSGIILLHFEPSMNRVIGVLSSDSGSEGFIRVLFYVRLGVTMSANPLDIYKKFDPKVIECFENIQRSAFSEGALPQKVKTLIAMAIDMEHGSVQG